MTFLRRFVSFLFVTAMLLPVFVQNVSAVEPVLAEPYSLNAGELLERIQQTYDDARALAGRRNFSGKCSTLVNCSTLSLGIQSVRYDGDGRDEYDLYDNVVRTDGGYDVVRYDAAEYDLEAALNAISENGTRDVYNIIVGFESGRTASSSKYGHTCFIHGIVDGVVYYCESYDLYLNDVYYPEGEPIVCTIAEFANYYNIWASFEGVIHFDFPDEEAPVLTGMKIQAASASGFTLSFQATDNIGITDIYAKVWTYGETEADAVTVPVIMFRDAAAIRVNTDDFDGFDGKYYVNCYAMDRKGNVSVVSSARDGVSLYQWEEAQGTYRVGKDNTGIHNAPYVRVNDTNTRQSALNTGAEVSVVGSYVNNDGELWYLLPDGGWICGENLRQTDAWSELVELVWSFFAEVQMVYLSGIK